MKNKIFLDQIINFFSLGKGRSRYFLLFITISLLFWILTKLSNEYNSIVNFELKFKNLPSYIILKDTAKIKINVSVKTSGFELIFHNIFHKSIKLDFSSSEFESGIINYKTQSSLHLVKDFFGSNAEIIAIFPEEIKINYIKNKRKLVLVKPPKKILIKSGYGVSNDIKFKPDSVWVNGPIEILDTLYFLRTEFPTNKLIDKDFLYEFKIINNNKNIFLENEIVNANISIERFSEKTIQVPINIKNLPDSIAVKLFPSQVEVKFLASLNKIKRIHPNHFFFSTNFKKINDSIDKYLQINLDSFPSQLENIRWLPKKVIFLIRK